MRSLFTFAHLIFIFSVKWQQNYMELAEYKEKLGYQFSLKCNQDFIFYPEQKYKHGKWSNKMAISMNNSCI